MAPAVTTWTPEGSFTPIGPYNHIAVVGDWITIGGLAGFDPETGELAGSDVTSQTRRIIKSFEHLLSAAGSDFAHVVHINIFMKDMAEFDAMNAAYADAIGEHRPARTAIGVAGLPKSGLRLTMNLTAVRAR